MCGIVGLYLKKKKLHNRLGSYLSGMLHNMSSRGPDSAGFAIYNNNEKLRYKYSPVSYTHLTLPTNREV